MSPQKEIETEIHLSKEFNVVGTFEKLKSQTDSNKFCLTNSNINLRNNNAKIGNLAISLEPKRSTW